MSIFTQNKLALPETASALSIAISNSATPTIAVATNSRILFFQDNGDKIEYEISRSIQPSYIEWHPTLATLAIGWINGLITLWTEENRLSKEDANIHKSIITKIVFHPNGGRMVTCDEKGTVAIWRGMQCMAVYQKEGAITQCIFVELNLAGDGDLKNKASNLFFFGGKGGVICLADDAKHCSEVCKVGGSIQSLLFYEKENSVIVISSSCLLVQFKINPNEKTPPDRKVKLSIAGDPEQIASMWIGSCLISTCSTENMLRLLHIEKDENYALTLADVDFANNTSGKFMSDKIICQHYDETKRLLVGGTKEGRLLFWKNGAFGVTSPSAPEQWKPLSFLKVEHPITGISIGKGSGTLAIKYGGQVSVVYETNIKGRLIDNIKILQTLGTCVQVYVRSEVSNQMFLFETKNNIRGVDCSNRHLVVCSGKRVEVHEFVFDVKETSTKMIAFFEDKCSMVTIVKDKVLLLYDYQINVSNYQGNVKQTLNFSEVEGAIAGYQLQNNTLVVYTNRNYIRLFDVSRRDVKQNGVTRKFENSSGELGNIRSVALNADGTKALLLTYQRKGAMSTMNSDSNFYIYDQDLDSFVSYKFGNDRLPTHAAWDNSDKRLFVVQTELCREGGPLLQLEEKKEGEDAEPWKGREAFTFFYTSEHGVKQQDVYKLENSIESLFSVAIPNLHFVSHVPNQDPAAAYKIIERPLKDFAGLENADDAVRKAIVDFGFYLSIGNLDEAYKAVKMVQNPVVWENMAQMCVKTKRLDVAEICLGNMKFARGVRAVRESKGEPEIEAQLATVAIQLNMKEEAQSLYEQAKRYDLLTKFFQSSGEWDKALKLSETYSRIDLPQTYYQLGRMHELSRQFEKAIEFYEKSGNHVKEVPRMLLQANEVGKLKEYINSKNEKGLFKWWGQYCESQQKFEEALQYYRNGEDFSAIVKLYIYLDNFAKAQQVASDSNDPLACYYVAKHLEMRGDIRNAIQMYAKSQHYNHAVRLARENNFDGDIFSLSLHSPKNVALQSAAYFEGKNQIEKAIILYIRGRNFKKALDLATKHKLYDYIKKITAEVGEDADPETLNKVAQYLLQNNQPDKAIHLLLALKQFDKALELCIEHNVPITQDIFLKVVPDKQARTQDEEKERLRLTMLIAKKSKKQGNFDLASKIYIQLGEKVKAMKCLIKLGDVEKVIAFANNARIPEIFVLAGNFLQNSDWHATPQLMKFIINFYGKAKAWENLAAFYEACATLEIDEYRDYDKATAALREALKYSDKSASENKEARKQQIEEKILFIDKFQSAKANIASSPDEAVRICVSLVENSKAEAIVRVGDVYGFLVEHFYRQGDMKTAYTYIQKMQAKKIILNPYVDQEIIEKVLRSNGITLQKNAPRPKIQKPDDEEIEEKI